MSTNGQTPLQPSGKRGLLFLQSLFDQPKPFSPLTLAEGLFPFERKRPSIAFRPTAVIISQTKGRSARFCIARRCLGTAAPPHRNQLGDATLLPVGAGLSFACGSRSTPRRAPKRPPAGGPDGGSIRRYGFPRRHQGSIS